MPDPIVIEVRLDEREAEASAARLKRQIDAGLAPDRRHTANETKERAHHQRIEAIQRQASAALQVIAARREAQLDAIRERAAQRAIEHERKIQRETQRSANAFDLVRGSLGRVQAAFAALAAFGAVALFERIGRAALDSAIAIDNQVNTLKALTGSAQVAERRFAELIALAQKTPGLTTSLAATLDVQLRILNTTEQTIDRLLPAIGKLNAIAPLGDPRQFVSNLQQLITQGFERQDLKELVGNSPFAGELIKELFNVDSPTNAKAIREAAGNLGIKTFEDFAIAFAKTAENNPRLQAVTESIGTQFEKLQDRIDIALAPLGRELANVLLPIFPDLIKAVEQFGAAGAQVFKDNREDIIAMARAIGDATVETGRFLGRVNELGQQIGLWGTLRDSIREVALMAATASDLLNGDFSGTRTQRLAQDFRIRDSQSQREPSAISGAIATLAETSAFLAADQRRPGGRRTGDASAAGGTARASRVESERAREIKDLLDKISEAKEARLDQIVKDLEAIEKSLTASVIEEDRRIKARPGQLAGFSAANAERLRQIDLETLRLEQNTTLRAAKEAAEAQEKFNEELKKTVERAQELDPAFRFMRGLRGETDQVAASFDRLGQSIGDSFGDLKNLLSSLGNAVKQFFGDLLSATLRNAAAAALSPLFGGGGAGGGIGNLFRTPGTFPAQLAQAFAGAGGGGLTAPPSISATATGIFANGAFARGLAGGGSASGGGLGGILGRLFGGGGGGGLLGGLAGAAPLLGLSLGSGLGGTSTAGNILGAIGGGAVGLGVSFGASVFSAAGGGLGALGPAALAALGPIALIGAPLLIGAVLLGKASQRRKDEEASGQMLTQALNAINELKAGIASDQIEGSQAKAIFDNNILGPFKQQIGTLKTESVRSSRLTNQVRDLQNVFNASIPPEITAQQERRRAGQRSAAIDSRLIPQFATGGISGGGLAIMHPNEMVLTPGHQSAIRFLAGADVFDRVGVPGVQQQPVFERGGIMPSNFGRPQIVIQNLVIESDVVMSEADARRTARVAFSGQEGEDLLVEKVQSARKNRRIA